MGNEIGKTSSRMGIAAIAAVTAIDKNEITTLQRKFREASQRSGNSDVITRTDFDEAVGSIENMESSDAELLDRLFTMFDTSGDNQIDFREFTVGISPLITGTVYDKIDFMFQMYDMDKTGSVVLSEMKRIFTAVNSVASYFGDPVLTSEQIEELALDVVKKNGNPAAPVKYQEYLQLMADHQLVQLFASARGTERFGR
mmetsp:Transcript_17959/g.18024  ORF Transcript_17959/g.18024 Transcript_17959/m.18024 type:complete len:199 (-) Transcript_17959:132-728(-)|eukprot:CAMPEP_0182428826 /NCGR_PEP_ID=MMETSP1167-20130531/23867_1 /TAXON_ID=2988 /ORGANISM="Mallomonas Sp, Strain CCMP3275" /LENGTH=198 /DNA_ID=CAMNT_0024611951 /DNA_START=64 /DNA_END=660 /DNA_ORIENTATION=+